MEKLRAKAYLDPKKDVKSPIPLQVTLNVKSSLRRSNVGPKPHSSEIDDEKSRVIQVVTRLGGISVVIHRCPSLGSIQGTLTHG